MDKLLIKKPTLLYSNRPGDPGQTGKTEETMSYSIRYGTGAGDMTGIDDLDTAKERADEGATYTQNSIVIEDEDGDEVCRRPWVGVRYDPNNPDTECFDRIDFGEFGYYAD
jgi:hypothetical protein